MNLTKMRLVTFLVLCLVLIGCKQDKPIPKPIEQHIIALKNAKTFSIILKDMDIKSDRFAHKYTIVEEPLNGEVTVRETGWERVSEGYFDLHQKNLGMQLASKNESGFVSRTVCPPGYDVYVGNEKYGKWENESKGEDSTRWVPRRRYIGFYRPLGWYYYPLYRPMYRDYSTYYRGKGRTYYGESPGGKSYYGTKSDISKKRNPDFYARKARSKNWTTGRPVSSSRRSGRGSGFGSGK